MVIPHLQAFPLPNSVLVLDNCAIHHTHVDQIKHMAHERGAKVVFLSPYCCIDSPIEYGFSQFKALWRRHAAWLELLTLSEAIEYCLSNCYLDGALSAGKTYFHCGYQL